MALPRTGTADMQEETGMATDETAGRPHPEVVRRVAYEETWPAGEPFPLTPLEAWHVMQGWEVVPAGGMTLEQAGRLPGRVEAGDGPLVRLWQC